MAENTTGGNTPNTNKASEGSPNASSNSQTTPNLTNSPEFGSSKHKVKINGAESEVSYKELIDGYQLNKLSLTKMNESNAEMKAAREFLKQMGANPAEAFKLAGLDPRKWANQYLLDQYDADNTPAEEKERKKILAELEQYRNKEQESLKQKELAEIQEMAATIAPQIENSIMKSLDSSGLPKNHTTVKMIAERMMDYYNAGYKDVTVEEVIPDVKAKFQELLTSFYSNANDDQLLGMLGEDYTKRIINAKTKTFKQTQNFKKATPVQAKTVSKEPVEKKTMDQKFKEIQNKFNPKK